MNKLFIILFLLIATPVNAGYERIYPTVDASVQWTPSSGSDNYAMVDDDPYDEITYNNATAVGKTDRFKGASSIPRNAIINSVIIYAYAKEIPPCFGSASLSLVMFHDGLNVSSATATTSSYKLYTYDVTALESWEAGDFGDGDGDIQFGYSLATAGCTGHRVTLTYMDVFYTAVYDTEIHDAEIHDAELH